ncbi:hypothetical protein AB1Y20_019616 [Prymnesium parvum]|uniref:Uncharacterized protein n=1 Tax=Prymnesium parvum TaxID=97485 RepID=A0AB34JRK7_PRYPA
MAPPIKYNFYQPSGSGRDGFIMHVSTHQTNFTYVAKAPEFAGNRQNGMANSLVGYSKDTLPKPSPPLAVSGYTGRMPGLSAGIGTVFGTFQKAEEPLPLDAFTNVRGAAPPPEYILKAIRKANEAHERRAATPGFRMPGYGGHLSGYKHLIGQSFSAAVGSNRGPVLPCNPTGAPGMSSAAQCIVPRNLQPGVVMPREVARTKSGYCGHLPGKHYSTNFGKPFTPRAEELLATNGQPAAGGIGDPGRPFIADVDSRIAYPNGHVGRPKRYKIALDGYTGFVPK